METRTTMNTEATVNPEAVERVEKKAWPFHPVEIEVTPDMVKDYFEDTPAAVSRLLDTLLLKMPYTLEQILDEDRAGFEEFVRAGYGEY